MAGEPGEEREPREPQEVSGAELAVLQVLWETPGRSIRQIAEALYPRNAQARYPTVQKQLERLEAKGFVRRDRSLMVHLFSAAVGRDEFVGKRLDAVVDTLCGGSLVPVLTHFLHAPRLSDAERSKLKELIDAIGRPSPADPADRPAPPKGRRQDRKAAQDRKDGKGGEGRKE